MSDKPLIDEAPVPAGHTRYRLASGPVDLPSNLSPEDLNTRLDALQQPEAYTQRVNDPLGQNPVVAGARQTYQNAVVKPLNKAVGTTAAVVASGLGMDPAKAEGLGESVSESVVPQTMTEAGMAVGAGVGGKLAKPLTRGGQALGRMLGATLGGASGGELGGEGAVQGGTKGLVASGTGEVLGSAVPWLVRSAPGMQKQINKNDTKNFVSWVESQVPTFKGAPKTAEGFEEFVRTGDAKNKLLTMFKDGFAEVKAALPTYAVGGTRHLHVPALGGRVTLEEFQDALSKLGNAGFGGQKADWKDRTIVGREARELWAEVITQGKASMSSLDPSGRAVRIFDAIHGEYSRGSTVLGMVKNPQAFRQLDNRVDLNVPHLQQTSKHRASQMTDRFGQGGLDDLRGAVRAGEYGKDLPAPGAGRFGEAVGDVYLRGRGGAPQVVGSMIRGLLPNAGARYNSRPPVSLNPGERAGLDAVTGVSLLPMLTPNDYASPR